ncbi:unnamed protein product [Gulo gulo]|uniref:Uncharacterized protein n=1 Tax=Gulo gulo TaxID=48420 RepID=A0A9X9LRD7_GULGU|nr:unnamed protein product [Gulo gulo]
MEDDPTGSPARPSSMTPQAGPAPSCPGLLLSLRLASAPEAAPSRGHDGQQDGVCQQGSSGKEILSLFRTVDGRDAADYSKGAGETRRWRRLRGHRGLG